MFRLLSIAILLFAIEKIHFVSQLIDNTSKVLFYVYSRYQYGFFKTYMFLIIPFFIAGMIDWKIVYCMFFPKKSHQNELNWRMLIMLNYISSSVFVLAMTHLLTYADKVINITNMFLGPLENQLNFENRLALILVLVSMTYLVGFFCVSLIFNDLQYNERHRQDEKQTTSFSDSVGGTEMKKLVSFVPPVYYLGEEVMRDEYVCVYLCVCVWCWCVTVFV